MLTSNLKNTNVYCFLGWVDRIRFFASMLTLFVFVSTRVRTELYSWVSLDQGEKYREQDQGEPIGMGCVQERWYCRYTDVNEVVV